ncbi:NADP-dependent oxidoreductase domain-containing protein [Xylariaceae sp. AK1471]|nr:NADP-dependent oxidoreductase domain-containing protein [Xylariaceae sp. AK1471]
MTKCHRVVCDPENYDAGCGVAMLYAHASQSKDYVNSFGLSRTAIFNSVEASLARLGTTYIDVLQIHRYDDVVEPEETMRALDDLVRAGKVRYLGASSMGTYQFTKLQNTAERLGLTKFVSMQNHYNLIYREEEREMVRYCNETGIGIIPWSPLAFGQLVRSPQKQTDSVRSQHGKNGAFYYDDDVTDSDIIISRVEEIAKKRDWPMSHVVLAWLNRRVTVPIVGLSSDERLDEVLGARGKVLTEAEEAYLERALSAQVYSGPRVKLGSAEPRQRWIVSLTKSQVARKNIDELSYSNNSTP